MASVISDLRLAFIPGTRTVLYRKRPPGSTLDQRIRASAVAYRTFVADGAIHTDVLVENGAGEQEFVALHKLTFMKSGPDIQKGDRAPDFPAQL